MCYCSKRYKEDHATAPLDGVAVELSEVLASRGGVLSEPEGVPKPLITKEDNDKQKSKKNSRSKTMNPMSFSNDKKAGEVLGRKLSAVVDKGAASVKASVVPLVSAAKEKASIAQTVVKGHTSAAHERVKKHVKKHEATYGKWLGKLGLAHLLTHVPMVLFVLGCLGACCGVSTVLRVALSILRIMSLALVAVFSSVAPSSKLVLSPRSKYNNVGMGKKGDDGEGSSSSSSSTSPGFGKWDATKALQNSTGLDPKVLWSQSLWPIHCQLAIS